MSALSEREIIDMMQTALKDAIDAAHDLAILSAKGPSYNKLRESLALVEGACRQLSVWREDTRWLNIGMVMAECHQRAGGWLRGYKDPATGIRLHYNAAKQNPLFSMLAANLAGIYAAAEELRTAKTGRRGMILPDVGIATRRVGAPVQVLLPPSVKKTQQLLVPARYAR